MYIKGGPPHSGAGVAVAVAVGGRALCSVLTIVLTGSGSVGVAISTVGVEVGKPKLGPKGACHLRKKSGYPKPKPINKNTAKSNNANVFFKVSLPFIIKNQRNEYNT
jgi:hypothetical protein